MPATQTAAPEFAALLGLDDASLYAEMSDLGYGNTIESGSSTVLSVDLSEMDDLSF